MKKTVTLTEIEVEHVEKALGARVTQYRAAMEENPTPSAWLDRMKLGLRQVLDASEKLRAAAWEIDR